MFSKEDLAKYLADYQQKQMEEAEAKKLKKKKSKNTEQKVEEDKND